MNGAQRDKIIFFPQKLQKKGIKNNVPFVFSRENNKNVPFPAPLQSHFNQLGKVSEELLTRHQKAWLPNWG